MRDRAMILLGYAGALRRGELAAVRREHVTFTPDGLRLLVPRSKGDPEGRKEEVGVPYGGRAAICPVRALEEWLRASRCGHGPVFRNVEARGGLPLEALHPDAVRRILRRRAAAAGLSAPPLARLSPHGLRAGFVTEAYNAGARDVSNDIRNPAAGDTGNPATPVILTPRPEPVRCCWT